MKAAVYEQFRQPMEIREVADPSVPADGVVLAVGATGLCRSDWHGWMGHDADIRLPHVPGHEIAGRIEAVGADVRRFRCGERVTLPFVCGCGRCPQCVSGQQQVCDHQFQPGFTHWGSFAEFVAIRHADDNLVRLPDELDFERAASLGCRFATAYRAVVDQARLRSGEWIAVHGCGGVGLAAIAIASARGARAIGIDPSPGALALAERLGAEHCIDGARQVPVAQAVRELTGGGAQVSMDAFGSAETFRQSIDCLAKRGRHVQVGLMTGAAAESPVPAARIIAEELEILGSHGMQAHRYPEMLELVSGGRIDLELLAGRSLSLEEGAAIIGSRELRLPSGISVINRFD